MVESVLLVKVVVICKAGLIVMMESLKLIWSGKVKVKLRSREKSACALVPARAEGAYWFG